MLQVTNQFTCIKSLLEMLEMQQSAPVITQSLLTRYASMDTEKYGEKIIASLRNQFGGHAIPKK